VLKIPAGPRGCGGVFVRLSFNESARKRTREIEARIHILAILFDLLFLFH
jgi:hypothetical protein